MTTFGLLYVIAFAILCGVGAYLNYRANTFYPSIFHIFMFISGVIGVVFSLFLLGIAYALNL